MTDFGHLMTDFFVTISDFSRVVVEEVREADAEVPVPTSEVRLVGEALDTFIAWPSRLLQPISRRTQVL